MGLYVGIGDKVVVNSGGIRYRLNLFSSSLVTDGIGLLSSERYRLKDRNGVYLLASEKSPSVDIPELRLLSSDRFILKDNTGIYLVSKNAVIDEKIMVAEDSYIITDSNGVYLALRE